jgi:hypothetical protein
MALTYLEGELVANEGLTPPVPHDGDCPDPQS